VRFSVLATDFDGTLAENGSVELSTIHALERLRASGRRAVLVTGREIEDMTTIFPQLGLFDWVVAENGALVYHPSSGEIKPMHEPPSAEFVHELRRRNVSPLSVGHVVVATVEPFESVVLEVIKNMGLELEIIFNKGSVMVLPSGVNKATGLEWVLKKLNTPFENVVGVGDAENDHALLKRCGCGVAVNNAIPALKECADYVTSASDGAGVAELIDLIIAKSLREAMRSRSAPST